MLEWLQQIFWVSEYLGNLPYLKYGKCSKILTTIKETIPYFHFLSSPVKQREVTNSAKGGNLM